MSSSIITFGPLVNYPEAPLDCSKISKVSNVAKLPPHLNPVAANASHKERLDDVPPRKSFDDFSNPDSAVHFKALKPCAVRIHPKDTNSSNEKVSNKESINEASSHEGFDDFEGKKIEAAYPTVIIKESFNESTHCADPNFEPEHEVLDPAFKEILNTGVKPSDWETKGKIKLISQLQSFGLQFTKKTFRLDDKTSQQFIEELLLIETSTSRNCLAVIQNSWKLLNVFENNLLQLGIPNGYNQDLLHFLAFTVSLKKFDEDFIYMRDFYSLFAKHGFIISMSIPCTIYLEEQFISFIYNGLGLEETKELTLDVTKQEMVLAETEANRLEERGERVSKIIEAIDIYYEARCNFINKFMDRDPFWKKIGKHEHCLMRLQYLKEDLLPLLIARADELSSEFKKKAAALELDYLSFKRRFLLSRFLVKRKVESEDKLTKGQREDFELDLKYYSPTDEKHDAVFVHYQKAIVKNPKLYELRHKMNHAVRMKSIVSTEISFIEFNLSRWI